MKGSITRKAFLMSLSLHTLVISVWFLCPHKEKKEEDANKAIVEVITVNTKIAEENKRVQLTFKRRIDLPVYRKQEKVHQKLYSSVKQLAESNSKINEVLKRGPAKLIESATKARHFPRTEIMPEIDTVAKLTPSDITLPIAISTPTNISSAKGVRSTRQVVAGKGTGGLASTGGLGFVNSNRASDGASNRDINFDINAIEKGKATPTSTEWEIRNGLAEIADKIIQLSDIAQKKVDVVFLLDTSGSMTYIINTVRQYINHFISKLEAGGMDYALGLVSFAEHNSEVALSALGTTSDLNAFKAWMSNIFAYGGGDFPEPSLEAIVAGLEDISFREGTNKVFVLYTDAPFHKTDRSGRGFNEILNILTGEGVTVHVVSIEDSSLQKLAKATNGIWRELPRVQLDKEVIGKKLSQREMVKFLPSLDPDLEFLIRERNKRLGLPTRDVLFLAEIYAYENDKKHKPQSLAEIISGMVKYFGYSLEDSLDFPNNNNNSIAEPGETIGLTIILKNTVGNVDAENVSADLEPQQLSQKEGVVLLSEQGKYGTIPANQISSASNYRFTISPDFKGTTIVFQLKITGLVYSTNYELGTEQIRIYVKQWQDRSGLSEVSIK